MRSSLPLFHAFVEKMQSSTPSRMQHAHGSMRGRNIRIGVGKKNDRAEEDKAVGKCSNNEVSVFHLS